MRKKIEIGDMLTNSTINFFDVEIENEQHGGVSPATLDSAIDSLAQAPSDVIIEWCNDNAVVDASGVSDFVEHIENMRKQLGGDTDLRWILRQG